jgi:hypothetical protein
MSLFEGKTSAERNKMIAAVMLPILALIFVVRMFFGSSTSPRPTSVNARPTPSRSQVSNPKSNLPAAVLEVPTKIEFTGVAVGSAEAGRNIFLYYIKPDSSKIAAAPSVAPPTPTPTPPLDLRSLNPSSVYARTSGFTLQVTGDKFTAQSRVYLDGQEMPTQFRGPQQLAATVSAASLSGPGMRQVVVRTPDNALYSNTGTLNVMQPPAPTHTFIGMIRRTRSETALLKNPKGDLVGVEVSDIVEGRFRVASISERSVELVDKDLNIKHTLPYVELKSTGPMGRVPGSIQPPPVPTTTVDDEEP